MAFAEILKELRTERGMTQVELANKLDFSRAIVSHWEKGRNEPTAEVLLMLSKFFDVTTDYLLGLESDYGTTQKPPAKAEGLSNNVMTFLTKEEEEILSYFNAMSAGLKAETKGFMRGILAASGVNIENLKGV